MILMLFLVFSFLGSVSEIYAMQQTSHCNIVKTHFDSTENYHLNRAAVSIDGSQLTALLAQERVRNAINIPDENNINAIHCAVRRNKISNLKKLLAAGARVDVATDVGFTPLHVAAHVRSWKSAQILLRHGADVAAVDAVGCTPLHTVVSFRSNSMKDGEQEKNSENETEFTEDAKMKEAAEDMSVTKMVGLLLLAGADRYARETNKLSPLDHACRNGYLEAARLMLCQPVNKYSYEDLTQAIGIAKISGKEALASLLSRFTFQVFVLSKSPLDSTKEQSTFNPDAPLR